MELQIPTKTFVEERMRIVLPEPEKVNVSIPKALTDTGFNWPYQLYQNKKVKRPPEGEPYPKPELNDKYEMPPLWNLRPKRYEKMEELLAEIAELPRDTGHPKQYWRPNPHLARLSEAERKAQNIAEHRVNPEHHIPQVIPEYNRPFSCAWLKPDQEDSLIVDGKIAGKGTMDTWVYRGRKIKPTGNRWKIESASPDGGKFEWALLFSDSHPTIDYTLNCTLWTRYYEYNNSWGGGYSRYPEPNVWDDANAPNYQRPLSFDMWVIGWDVYGHSYITHKKLGFFGALDVAINFIEGVEWSYDLAKRPAYLGESPSVKAPATKTPASDPILDAVQKIKERNNPKEFTKSGKPFVRVTSKEAGQKVSGKQRDTAWKQISK